MTTVPPGVIPETRMVVLLNVMAGAPAPPEAARALRARLIERNNPAMNLYMDRSLLLQAQKHENLALTARQRLEGLADDGAGAVDLHAAEVDGLGEHGHARFFAGDEEIADGDRVFAGVDAHLDAAGGGDLGVSGVALAEEQAGLFGDDAGNGGVIGGARLHHF